MKRLFIGLCLLAACASPALGQLSPGGAKDALLEPEKAFRFSARTYPNAVEVRFAIADGYYMYRERLRFAAQGNPDIRLGIP